MASLNKVLIIGNLGRDPEIRYMPSGDAMCNISVATTDVWKDKSGERQEKTEWHRIVVFGRLAEVAGEYLKKGSQAYFEGRLQTRKWTDKEGQERYTTEIACDTLKMLDKKPAGAGQGQGAREYTSQSGGHAQKPVGKSQGERPANPIDDMEDDIPFASCDVAHDVIHRNLRWRL